MTDPKPPIWYSDAFDDYLPFIKELEKREDILEEGFVLPDTDGSRSAQIRDYAVTNNTVDHRILRESLKDLYLNSHAKLTASNTDNVHFYRWEGSFKSFKREKLTTWYEITLPWDVFIYPDDKDNFKWSQFHARWITLEELMNNWDVFKWTILVFVSRRVASNYEIWIEEQSVKLRIQAPQSWMSGDVPVYIYKFDTNYQRRVPVSFDQLRNSYDWKLPFSATEDQRIAGLSRVILTFNYRLSSLGSIVDRDISETLGQNLEFLEVDMNERYIDVGTISATNISYLRSKELGDFWMNIIVPKFFHEYPILLPTDTIYRPLIPTMQPVQVMKQGLPTNVKASEDQDIEISDGVQPWKQAALDESGKVIYRKDEDGNYILDENGNRIKELTYVDERLDRQVLYFDSETGLPVYPDATEDSSKQVYIDRYDYHGDNYDGWVKILRPIVLSDAFRYPEEPYENIMAAMDAFRAALDSYTKATKEFPYYLRDDTNKNDENWDRWIGALLTFGNDLWWHVGIYFDSRNAPRDIELEEAFEMYSFHAIFMLVGSPDRPDEKPWTYLHPLPNEWYDNVRFIISKCWELINRFYMAEIVTAIARKLLWYREGEYDGMQRFHRPVNDSDFIFFEYDIPRRVWWPRPLRVRHHFPDVYTLSPKDGDTIAEESIFKAFFFYSDTMNVREIVKPHTNPSVPQYDEELAIYQRGQGDFKDIFIEKFYWMAIDAIYSGMLTTKNRWEVIEYIIDNKSYRRFNELFLETADPYFKMGLATYLKSNHYEFPFDDAVAKLQEAMSLKRHEFSKITSFEHYLNKQWVPSYFDTMIQVMDDYNISDRHRRRPPLTFDHRQVKTFIEGLLADISEDVVPPLQKLRSVLLYLAHRTPDIVLDSANDIPVTEAIFQELEKEEIYQLDVSKVRYFYQTFNGITSGLSKIVAYINNLDPEIYRLSEMTKLTEWLSPFENVVRNLGERLTTLREELDNKSIWVQKKHMLTQISELANGKLSSSVSSSVGLIGTLDISRLNEIVYNQPFSDEQDESSLVVQIINNGPWNEKIRDTRESIHLTLVTINQFFAPNQVLTPGNMVALLNNLRSVDNLIQVARQEIRRFWSTESLPENEELLALFAEAMSVSSKIVSDMEKYYAAYTNILGACDDIRDLIATIPNSRLSSQETSWKESIHDSLDAILIPMSTLGTKTPQDTMMVKHDTIDESIDKWKIFVQMEETIFTLLDEIVEDPCVYLERFESIVPSLMELNSYIGSLKSSFIPNGAVPDLLKVYLPSVPEIVSHGFNYDENEIIIIPGIGCYAVNDELIDFGFYNRVLTNPISDKVHPTASQLLGFGLTIKCTDAEETNIVDDTIVQPLLKQLEAVLASVSKGICNPNPQGNTDLNRNVTQLESISMRVTNTLADYDGHISDVVAEQLNLATEVIDDQLLSLLLSFIDVRSKCDLHGVVHLLTIIVREEKDFIARYTESSDDYVATMQPAFDKIKHFFGSGLYWNNVGEMLELLELLESDLNSFRDSAYDHPVIKEILKKVNDLSALIDEIRLSVSEMNEIRPTVLNFCELIGDHIATAKDNIHQDCFYRVTDISISESGDNYQVGDIFFITGSSNTVYAFQVLTVAHGKVLKVKPLMDYALEEQLWGRYTTERFRGNGSGLTVIIRSELITIADSTVGSDFEPLADQYDDGDLVEFKFPNVYDLDVNYEVFIGGKQITDFIQRHEEPVNLNNPGKVDVLYLNANQVSNLRNMSIQIMPEQYFVYRINGIDIKDPGAGYYNGQEIYVDAGEICLRLFVAKLYNTPYKSIQEVSFGGRDIIFKDKNPSAHDSEVVWDGIMNIDDEFNVGKPGSYDWIGDGDVHIKTTAKEFTGDPATVSSAGGSTTLSILTNLNDISVDPEDHPEQPTSKPATFTHDGFERPVARYPTVVNGDTYPVDNRNATFMYPNVNMVDADPAVDNGDPYTHRYQGSRIDNSQVPMVADRWNGIKETLEISNPFIPDIQRQPPYQPPKGEYQLIHRCRFHRSSNASLKADLEVGTLGERPRFPSEWPDGTVGRRVAITVDSSKGDHRWIYRVIELTSTGFFRYDDGVIADIEWNYLDVDWMQTDCYQEEPCTRHKYPKIKYWSVPTWKDGVEKLILQNMAEIDPNYEIKIRNMTTYIHNLGPQDISVYNWTLKRWENVYDTSQWLLEVRHKPDDEDFGFKLTYVGNRGKDYSYDLKFYIHKTPATQMRNQRLIKPATMDIISTLVDDIDIPGGRVGTHTGRGIRIRKLMPFEHSFTVSGDETVEHDMPYMHYRNEIHLSDIMVRDTVTSKLMKFPEMFRIDFRDDTRLSGTQLDHRVEPKVTIISGGREHFDGWGYGYNETSDLHVFGWVQANSSGQLVSFTPAHFPKLPRSGIFTFDVYQNGIQGKVTSAKIGIEFILTETTLENDGYIHNVVNPLSPLPDNYRLRPLMSPDNPLEISISLTPRSYGFMEHSWLDNPMMTVDNWQAVLERWYVLVNGVRYPLVNPSTKQPTLKVQAHEGGMDITFRNLYRPHEQLEFRALPYPVRSVYTQRNIPKHGFIDLAGRLNKPLNKKFYEFWVNGRLLDREVTIITPTKIFLHGLTSLKNFEIVEVNRDPHEYFSDTFLEAKALSGDRIGPTYNFKTYLDAALEGDRVGDEMDQYTVDEQGYLLYPVWTQVGRDHPEYKNYPENEDLEPDIMQRIFPEDLPLPDDFPDITYELMINDQPTIEGVCVSGQNNTFETFRLIPIDNNMIVNMLNEEWKKHIDTDPYFKQHFAISDDDWYGRTTIMYDEFGMRTNNLNDALYKVYDDQILSVNTKTKQVQIVPDYDLADLPHLNERVTIKD